MAAAPSPALAPPPGNPRFPLLDAMRALAAIAIVLTHTAGVSGFNVDNALGAYTARLNMGVPLFFLLSGFLLYRPFVAARLEGRPRVRIRDYTRRRILRIVPAYWVALTVLALWPGLPAFWDGPWWRSYTFTQNYWLDSTVQGIFPAWTLCIEISFYLALPFIAVAMGRLVGQRWRLELALLGALAIGSVALRSALQADGGFFVLQNTLATYLDWFVYGMVLAVLSVVSHRRDARPAVLRTIERRPWVPWLLAAVVFWFGATQLDLPRGFFLVYTNINYLGEHLGYALVAILLLLPAIFGTAGGGWPRRLLASRLLGWLGLVSYGIFLYHGPFVLWLQEQEADQWIPGSGYLSMTVVALAFAIACAAASYYLIERPALRFKDAPRGSSSLRRRSA
ncbi:MAG TPA: acyltransferase, partial [Solirubrobacteraceae bacterium]|nr:acyltransferase [Solirubrobacteraceae bacterium]